MRLTGFSPFLRLLACRVLAMVGVSLGLLLGAAGVCAQGPLPTLQLSEMTPKLSLADRSQFLVDRGGRLTAAGIEARQAELPFAVRPRGHQVLLGDGDALWVRFTARALAQENHWLLEVDLPGVDEVSLHFRNAAGQWASQQAGDSLPQSVWPQRGRKPFLLLSQETGRDVTYFLRIQHERVPFSGGLFIKTQTVVAEQEQSALFLLGAYFGLAALAIVVALANALVYRDHGFSTYVIYVAAMVLGQAGMTGAGGLLFWPEWPGLNNPMTFLMNTFAGATGVLFVRTVATPRQYSTLLDRLAMGVIFALMVVSAVDVFVPTAAGFALSMHLLTLTLSMLLVLVLLALAIARGDRHSRWIAAGFGLIVLGGAFPVARNFGLISSGFLSEYGLMLGSALEMPLLFYGLNRRLNEQTESRARARALAVTDPLTGLASGRKLLTLLQASLVRARTGRPFAMMVIELANHASLLREHGREDAERALVLAAARLKTVVRDIDTVARVGSQHFAVLMESPCTLEEANAMATYVVAVGLRDSGVLPDGATLRFHVVLSLLPVPDLDAQGTLQMLLQELKRITPDARKTIRTVRA
jgi:diguanylate cyclase (GGDEF)-like protein